MAIHQHANGADSFNAAPARRCFIAARPQTDILGIRRILSERGIAATASYERPWLGARPLDTVMALIEDADLVIAVLDDPSTSANSMFEVGFAFARDKKILVVVPRDSSDIPSNLDSTLYVRADTSDIDAIGFNLDQLLAAPQPRRKPHLPTSLETHPIGNEADRLHDELRRAIRAHDAMALERVVAEALRLSGVGIVRPRDAQPMTQEQPDLSIWCDDLESSVGNPLLIEIELSLRGARSVEHTRRQIAGYMSRRNVRWGLLLYGDVLDDPGGDIQSEAPILVLSVPSLIERLRTESFAAIVGSLRDQAISVA